MLEILEKALGKEVVNDTLTAGDTWIRNATEQTAYETQEINV